jgi:hypothetical protein
VIRICCAQKIEEEQKSVKVQSDPRASHEAPPELERTFQPVLGRSVMTTALRNTGIEPVGAMPWGTHFCHFYETRDDLLETLSSPTCPQAARGHARKEVRHDAPGRATRSDRSW